MRRLSKATHNARNYKRIQRTVLPELMPLPHVPSGGKSSRFCHMPWFYLVRGSFSADAEGAVKCRHYRVLANREL
jgi:hypothetical protein